jgi:hypothetical protein
MTAALLQARRIYIAFTLGRLGVIEKGGRIRSEDPGTSEAVVFVSIDMSPNMKL